MLDDAGHCWEISVSLAPKVFLVNPQFEWLKHRLVVNPPLLLLLQPPVLLEPPTLLLVMLVVYLNM
jgi:hypothetical protein